MTKLVNSVAAIGKWELLGGGQFAKMTTGRALQMKASCSFERMTATAEKEEEHLCQGEPSGVKWADPLKQKKASPGCHHLRYFLQMTWALM